MRKAKYAASLVRRCHVSSDAFDDIHRALNQRCVARRQLSFGKIQIVLEAYADMAAKNHTLRHDRKLGTRDAERRPTRALGQIPLHLKQALGVGGRSPWHAKAQLEQRSLANSLRFAQVAREAHVPEIEYLEFRLHARFLDQGCHLDQMVGHVHECAIAEVHGRYVERADLRAQFEHMPHSCLRRHHRTQFTAPVRVFVAGNETCTRARRQVDQYRAPAIADARNDFSVERQLRAWNASPGVTNVNVSDARTGFTCCNGLIGNLPGRNGHCRVQPRGIVASRECATDNRLACHSVRSKGNMNEAPQSRASPWAQRQAARAGPNGGTPTGETLISFLLTNSSKPS